MYTHIRVGNLNMYAVLASSADNIKRRLLLIDWKKDIYLVEGEFDSFFLSFVIFYFSILCRSHLGRHLINFDIF